MGADTLPLYPMGESLSMPFFFRIVVLSFCCGLWAGISAAEAAGGAAPSRDLFERHRSGIVQVRIVDRATGEKTSIGSGFAVQDGGLVVTNYHVVADLFNHPDLHRAEYLSDDNRRGELVLVDLDIVHDLALVRAEPALPDFFRLAAEMPGRGEKLFAMGNPLDLGLTIVEGTFSGFIQDAMYEQIHFTGSLNPGMSGGPAFLENGQVVGVNVATAGNQVSFLVPARFAASLVDEALDDGGAADDLLEKTRRQLLGNQEQLLARLLASPLAVSELGPFVVPGQVAPYVKCWGQTATESDLLYSQVVTSCSSEEGIYLSDSLATGQIFYGHTFLESDELDPFRFAALFESSLAESQSRLEGSAEEVGDFQCRRDFVEHNGMNFTAAVCFREYQRFPGLYDAVLKAATLGEARRGLHTYVVLTGVDFGRGLEFLQKYLEAIGWKR